MGQAAEEIKRLQADLNGLISVVSLPAIWSGKETSEIARTLLDALVGLLDLELAFLRIVNPAGPRPIEAVGIGSTSRRTLQAGEMARVLEPWLEHTVPTSAVAPNPVGDGDVAITTFPLGVEGDIGVLAAGSCRADFPTQFEKVLLRVAANEATLALQAAHRSAEQRKVGAAAERARLARELHDTLLQGFTGVTLQLQAVLQRSLAEGRDDAATLSGILSLADATLRDAREMIWDLRVSELYEHDLPGALELGARRAIGAAAIDLRVEVRGNRRPLAPSFQTAMLRIAREAVANTAQHANAHHVEVALAYEPGIVRLAVRDDGRGFEPGEVEAAPGVGHWGIVGMRERATLVGGTLEISSGEKRGTTVSLSLPTDTSA